MNQKLSEQQIPSNCNSLRRIALPHCELQSLPTCPAAFITHRRTPSFCRDKRDPNREDRLAVEVTKAERERERNTQRREKKHLAPIAVNMVVILANWPSSLKGLNCLVIAEGGPCQGRGLSRATYRVDSILPGIPFPLPPGGGLRGSRGPSGWPPRSTTPHWPRRAATPPRPSRENNQRYGAGPACPAAGSERGWLGGFSTEERAMMGINF